MEVVGRGSHERAACGSHRGQPRFEPVEKTHQLIDTGDDAVLFRERGDTDAEVGNVLKPEAVLHAALVQPMLIENER
jgi:hypothetical protein